MERFQKPLMMLILLLLASVPLYAWATGSLYPLTLFGRILVFVLAALGLNLVLGFGGMVSLGHAMYVGLGAYAVGIMSYLGIASGPVHLAVALIATTLVALPVGWIALRTHGIAFIMITLAFAQLFFYVFVSMRMLGGDDGLSIERLSDWGFGLAGNKYAIYIALLLSIVITLLFMTRLVASRFGLVLRATKVSEKRVNAVGLCDLRTDLRRGGLLLCQPHRLCVTCLHDLDDLGRTDCDGAAWWLRLCVWPRGGRSGFSAHGRGHQGVYRALGIIPRADHCAHRGVFAARYLGLAGQAR
jgi:Branched-chain amino acid transport system / permease component